MLSLLVRSHLKWVFVYSLSAIYASWSNFQSPIFESALTRKLLTLLPPLHFSSEQHWRQTETESFLSFFGWHWFILKFFPPRKLFAYKLPLVSVEENRNLLFEQNKHRDLCSPFWLVQRHPLAYESQPYRPSSRKPHFHPRLSQLPDSTRFGHLQHNLPNCIQNSSSIQQCCGRRPERMQQSTQRFSFLRVIRFWTWYSSLMMLYRKSNVVFIGGLRLIRTNIGDNDRWRH